MRIRRLIPCLAAALVCAFWQADARGQATCSFDAKAASVLIALNGQRADVSRTTAGAIRLNGTACGAADVTNTDTIRIQGVSNRGVATLAGDFSPGATPEPDGRNEIEFVLVEIRNITVTLSSGDDILVSTGSGIDVGGDGDVDVVGGTIWVVQAGAGDDIVDFAAQTVGSTLVGQEGNDHLIGGSAPEKMEGGAGDDVLEGNGSPDRIDGGPGNDIMSGGSGNDVFLEGAAPNGADIIDGGSAGNTVDYGGRTAPLSITLGAGADDGEVGEGDDIVGVRTAIGGSGDDVIVGDQLDNVLRGGPGDDQLFGMVNHDKLFGGPGDDFLQGDAGKNQLHGEDGNDTLVGNSTANERFRGGNGDDTITGLLDGFGELVDCGAGTDSAELNGEDQFTACEGL